MAQPAGKTDAAPAWAEERRAPDGSPWARAARAAARGRMHAPSRRDEYWRYTNPASLLQRDPPDAAIEPSAEVFSAIDRLRVVFRDGVLDRDASDPLALDHVEIQTLAEATATDIHWAREVFGQLEAAGQRPVARPFAAFNTAFAGDGMVLRVTCRAPRPLAFVYLHEDPRSDALLRHLIRLEPGAELTLLESGPGAARLNAVAEVDVAAGAAFHHLRVQGPDEERRSVVHLFARVAEGAVFKSFTLTANGALTRNETVVDLAGPRAVVHIAGAGLGDAGYHHDDTVFLTHSAPDCESRQVFKNVLRNGATGVFQGKILVAQAAQRTDGYQIAQGLMLDGDSQFLAKPELEIYADDVKCSHGSTVGAIDPVALFYLTSRGVPRRVAQDMLVLAFAAEALEEIEDEALRAATEALLQDWLAGHSSR